MVRAIVPAATRAWRRDGTVAWIVAHAVDDGGATGMLTVPYGTLPLLPERLRSADPPGLGARP